MSGTRPPSVTSGKTTLINIRTGRSIQRPNRRTTPHSAISTLDRTSKKSRRNTIRNRPFRPVEMSHIAFSRSGYVTRTQAGLLAYPTSVRLPVFTTVAHARQMPLSGFTAAGTAPDSDPLRISTGFPITAVRLIRTATSIQHKTNVKIFSELIKCIRPFSAPKLYTFYPHFSFPLLQNNFSLQNKRATRLPDRSFLYLYYITTVTFRIPTAIAGCKSRSANPTIRYPHCKGSS